MASKANGTVEGKLDEVIDILRNLLALELADRGVTQEKIGKHLGIAKSSVVEMLSGIKRGEGQSRDR